MTARRDFLLMIGSLMAGTELARAQSVPRVTIFIGTNDARADGIRRAWLGWFAADGFVEGRDVALTVVNAGLKDDPAHEQDLARRIVASRPSVICVPGGWMEMVMRLAREIPIVFYLVTDPVKNGFVKSLAHPGGNVTGVTSPYLALEEKRFELLKEIRPAAKRIAILARREHVRPMEEAAARLGVAVVAAPLSLEEFNSPQAIVRAAMATRADAFNVLMIDDAVPADLLAYFQRASIPATFDEAETVERGGLACIGEVPLGRHQRAYRLVVKILRGEKPATIPVDQQAKFHLAVNLRTAHAMGVSIPDSIRIRADQLVR